jgi:CMP-N-acetylneuraminic acid synthetase
LSSDTATTFEVVEHVIKKNCEFDYIVLLQPTSPLRKVQHIDEAIETLFKKRADAIISLCKVEHNPLFSNTLPKDGSLSGFLDRKLTTARSQDLEDYYRINGAIYIAKVNKVLMERSLFLKNNMFGYIMEKKFSVDIDNKSDFDYARFLMRG